MKLTLLGVPQDLGAENLGVDIGPNALRYTKIVDKLQNIGFEITDLGNISCLSRNDLEIKDPKLKYSDEIVRISKISAEKVNGIIKNDERVIVLGGDHSVNLGAVSGASVALEKDLGLIYFDAHADMNTSETTLTGNIHGMHLASLLGFGNKELVNILKVGSKIDKQNLLHIGGKDFDTAEEEFIKKEELRCFTIADILSCGLRPLLGMIDNLNSQVKNIWVSIDLDAIDSMYAPGAGMPNNGGLTYREIAAITKYIGKECNVVGVDVVEYNPLKDIDLKTAELAIELIAKLFGSDYSWYTHYLKENKIK